jgi:TatA/E family protein of Tat protein translocase
MFGLSLGHLLILGLVVLLFGQRRLPELGWALGKGMEAFKRGLEGKDAPPPPTEDSHHLK